LVVDLDDDRAAAKRYLEQALRWHRVRPELSELLRSLAHEEQRHRQWLQDMIVRADPQAAN
jgi:rubrerythrin